MVNKIKIITPSEPGGVLDYSNILSKGLVKKGYKSSVIPINKYKNKKFLNINKEDNVILQMSGYGYQLKGLPFWLINQIRGTKFETSSFGIFFHELHVNYKIWNPKLIITMILQKYINIRLLKYCDYWISNNANDTNWLKRYSSNINSYLCPTLSNVDLNISKVRKSKNTVIVFGTSPTRINIYKNNFRNLKQWILENNLILYDVGPKINDHSVKNLIENQSNIKICGKLSTKKIRDLFSKAYFGIFSLPDSFINKSGAFATYCKYKVCPINLNDLTLNKKKIINKRFLKFLPNISTYRNQILRINKFNFKFSQKNTINKHLEIYLKNIK